MSTFFRANQRKSEEKRKGIPVVVGLLSTFTAIFSNGRCCGKQVRMRRPILEESGRSPTTYFSPQPDECRHGLGRLSISSSGGERCRRLDRT